VLILRLALRNLLRHPVKTALIASFIALSSCLLYLTNGAFQSTEEGLQKSLVGSLTGHFAVSYLSEESYGLFGSEVPIVSAYEGIPAITDYRTVASVLDDESRVAVWTPIVSTLAQMRVADYAAASALFGVAPETYFSVCQDIEIIDGDPSALVSGGAFLNEAWKAEAERSLGRPLVLGEQVVFSVAVNNSFRLRSVPYAGTYRYPAPTDALNRVVLVDVATARSLAGYTLGYAVANQDVAQGIAPAKAESLDDLFSAAEDTVAFSGAGLTLDAVKKSLADTQSRDQLVMTDDAAWSFVLARGTDQKAGEAARKSVRDKVRKLGTEVRVLDWHSAAGANALMLFALKMAFNAGVWILTLGSVLIVMNALVISILERTGEIGTMRALGAGAPFVRKLIVLETGILMIASAALGVIMGLIIAQLLSARGIPVTNPLLASLFGGNRVSPSVDLGLAAELLAGAAIVSALAWIYPTHLALTVGPLAAMNEHE
jgi:putative ABC transport system permease protein